MGHVDPTLDAEEAAAVLMAAADGLGLRLAFMGDYSASAAASALKNLVLRYLNPAAAPQQISRSAGKTPVVPFPILLPLTQKITLPKSRAGASNDA